MEDHDDKSKKQHPAPGKKVWVTPQIISREVIEAAAANCTQVGGGKSSPSGGCFGPTNS